MNCLTRALVLWSLSLIGSTASAQNRAPAMHRCSPLVLETWSALAEMELAVEFNAADWNAARPQGRCSGASAHAQVRDLLARLAVPGVRLVPAAGVQAFLTEVTGAAHVGVGLRELLSVDVDERTRLLTIIAPTPGGPAARAGLRAGDVIEEIGEFRADTMDLAEAMALLRGPEGTAVQVRIRNDRETRAVTLVRESIAPSSPAILRMRRTKTGRSIGYLRLPDFSEGAANGLRRALADAEAAGATGLLLDLRDNPGGLVQELVAASDLFLAPGKAIARLRSGSRPETVIAASSPAETLLPLVALVNRGSASAAEAMAGALQANRRAVVVGQPTFGKGLAHSPTELSDGSLVLAPTSRLETPHGRDILRSGIAPDVLLPAPPVLVLDPDLDADSGYMAAVAVIQ